MGEFEDKLNSILSSPKDMEKILGLARELSGSLGGEKETKATEQTAQVASPKNGADSTLSGLGSIDPKIIGLIGKLMGEYNSPDADDKAALISAVKPYVRQERRDTLDRALKIAKLTHLARTALSEFGGDFHINL